VIEKNRTKIADASPVHLWTTKRVRVTGTPIEYPLAVRG
jgi:hypothetical protein